MTCPALRVFVLDNTIALRIATRGKELELRRAFSKELPYAEPAWAIERDERPFYLDGIMIYPARAR